MIKMAYDLTKISDIHLMRKRHAKKTEKFTIEQKLEEMKNRGKKGFEYLRKNEKVNFEAWAYRRRHAYRQIPRHGQHAYGGGKKQGITNNE